MGVQTVFIITCVLLLLNCLIFMRFVNSETIDTLCNVKGCNCTRRAAPWWDINCNLSKQQDLKLEPHHVPREISEITINNGRYMIITRQTFKNLPGFRFFRLENFKKIIIEQETFYNISAPSLIIQIINCDRLEIKTGAFDIKQSGLQIEIVHCATVSIEKSAFDLLDNATFKNVANLILSTGTFEFMNQRNVFNAHGPPSVISFDNVMIDKLPQHTFRSALARIDIKNSIINEVYNNAFYAIQISAIFIINTVINTIKIDAFSHGHTYIMDLEFTNCTISKIETKGIRAGITNLTIQHSRIGDIQSGAINISVAKVEILHNEIYNLHESSVILQNWNSINFTKNIIENMFTNFLIAPKNPEIEIAYLIYDDNDVQNVDKYALNFLSELDDNVIKYKKNFFNRTCYCLINDWISELLNTNKTTKINQIRENSFCIINDLLADCFQLSPGIININNFTKLVCNNNSNTVKCEPYRGEVKIVNITTTSKMLSKNNQQRIQNTNWLTLIISCTAVLIFLIIATLTIMLIKGSRWLKRKGYFRKIQYNNQHEQSNIDEENTIETVDENEQTETNEDLTLDLLQDLSKKLDDPNTHQAASEMIEQLYQKFIRNTNENNPQQSSQQQDDEAHLYEELGNLVGGSNATKNDNDSKTILKLMEERFNLVLNDIDDDEEDDDADDDDNNNNYETNNTRPALVGEYSEPSDAAIHLYSELKQNRDSEDNQDTLKSRTSTIMAFRPLPDKPGPSSKM